MKKITAVKIVKLKIGKDPLEKAGTKNGVNKNRKEIEDDNSDEE